MIAIRSMTTSVVPFLLAPARLSFRSRYPHLGPALRARRLELTSPECGRVVYYTNAEANAPSGERPVIFLHGIHEAASSFDMALLFEAFRAGRPCYALDLPGFGGSERSERCYGPELYIRAIEQLLEESTRGNLPADLVAVGLTCEWAAQAAVHQPGRVRSLTLISPTGFAVKHEQDHLERVARQGKLVWPMRWVWRLGLSPLMLRFRASKHALRHKMNGMVSKGTTLPETLLRYSYATSHQPGAERAVMAFLTGALYPNGNPQAVYTRVHCPTLIVRGEREQQRFGSLSLFVKWRDHFQAERVQDASLLHDQSAQDVAQRMRDFWERACEKEDDAYTNTPCLTSTNHAQEVAQRSTY
jgi:pimeloyl-ACP methyl ester carboxylesterase